MSGYSSEPPDPAAICFGLSRELDQRSCAAYLQLLGRHELAQTLCSRLSQTEIDQLIEMIKPVKIITRVVPQRIVIMNRTFKDEGYHAVQIWEPEKK